MKNEELLGDAFNKLQENNQDRIRYLDKIIPPPQKNEVSKEVVNITIFKIFENELKNTIFCHMIRESTDSEMKKYGEYNPRILKVINEEYKRSMYAYDKRNVELCTYLLIPTKKATLPFRSMVRAFEFKRKWQEELIYDNLIDADKMFLFNDSDNVQKNHSEFFEKMSMFSDARNIAAHDYSYAEKRDTEKMIENFLFLTKTLHSNIRK